MTTTFQIPKKLKPGDSIGIVAPASNFDDEKFNQGVKYLESIGLKVIFAKSLMEKHKYFAGVDNNRASQINEFFDDSSIKAIICARGGYGSLRILPLLDFELIKKNPKIFIGFSDITNILLALFFKCSLVSFHGPMVTTLPDADEKTKNSIKSLLFEDEKIKILSEKNIVIKQGVAKGRVLGGNLTTLCHLIGTYFEPDYKNCILFIEDRGEDPYKVDRILTQMKFTGCFKNLKGLVLGSFKDCGDYMDICEIVNDIFLDIDIPIIAGFGFGHGKKNLVLPIGLNAILDSEKNLLSFK